VLLVPELGAVTLHPKLAGCRISEDRKKFTPAEMRRPFAVSRSTAPTIIAVIGPRSPATRGRMVFGCRSGAVYQSLAAGDVPTFGPISVGKQEA
jgi:hypothetical protein